MKRYQIAIIAAFLITTSVQAQNSNIGIKGGLNVYNLVNENSSNGDPIVGFHVGLMSHIHLNEDLAFQPEMVFSTQGSEFSSGGVDTKLNLTYLNVPLMLQYMFDNGFRVQAGPQIGFLLDAKAKVGNAEFDAKDDFETLDLGLGLGIGYINPSSDIGIDARYNLGLTDINKDSPVDSYNRGFQLGVFYLFSHN